MAGYDVIIVGAGPAEIFTVVNLFSGERAHLSFALSGMPEKILH